MDRLETSGHPRAIWDANLEMWRIQPNPPKGIQDTKPIHVAQIPDHQRLHRGGVYGISPEQVVVSGGSNREGAFGELLPLDIGIIDGIVTEFLDRLLPADRFRIDGQQAI